MSADRALRKFAHKLAGALNEQAQDLPNADATLALQAVSLALLDVVQKMQDEEFAALEKLEHAK